MSLEIRDEPRDDFRGYSEIPISFLADRVLQVDGNPGHGPLRVREVDCVASAWISGRRVGGVVLIYDAPRLALLEGRSDLALLWDLRAHSDVRRQGVGRALVARAEEWARDRGCSEVKVETQNVNVAACRFYEACGFELRRMVTGAYPELPGETMLLWYKPIRR